MLREDRSVLDLLNADYTFLNERLAQHYGVPNVYGSHFRRVALTDEARFGLLGKGAVLMVTAVSVNDVASAVAIGGGGMSGTVIRTDGDPGRPRLVIPRTT